MWLAHTTWPTTKETGEDLICYILQIAFLIVSIWLLHPPRYHTFWKPGCWERRRSVGIRIRLVDIPLHAANYLFGICINHIKPVAGRVGFVPGQLTSAGFFL
jgi:hypothetical protein